MKDYYDFSKGKKNPYTKLLKTEITINLSNEVIDYFKELADEIGMSYQTLINFYLLDCVKHKKRPEFNWE